MREIKFRAWDKISKQMFDVYSIEFRKDGVWVCLDLVSKVTRLRENWLSPDRLELMQYTGLKDKNGKEIYEGDIVKINNLKETWKRGEPDFDWRIFAIEYNQYTWAFNNSVLYMPMSTYHDGKNGFYDYEIEVIGNIYENPELLNK